DVQVVRLPRVAVRVARGHADRADAWLPVVRQRVNVFGNQLVVASRADDVLFRSVAPVDRPREIAGHARRFVDDQLVGLVVVRGGRPVGGDALEGRLDGDGVGLIAL